MKKRIFKSGMTLIELVVVIGILGILFTAIYMFFVKGTEQFHFTRRQNHLATTGRLALETLSDEIIWAGYMPYGGWTEEQWQPVEVASDNTFDFYADRDGNSSLSATDYRNIYLDTSENILHITDDGSMDRIAGTEITAIQFNYLDGSGTFLAEPLNEEDRDAVRHVVIKLTLQSDYLGDVYQTVMQTMITPRNLGVFHNFDPLFYMPPPPDAKIVVNVEGDSTAHAPTVHQLALLNQLDKWGFSLVSLSDDQLAGYDYDSSGVDIVFLRNMVGDHTYLPGLADSLQVIPVPIIVLDPDDAMNIFSIGNTPSEVSGALGELKKIVIDHPIHDGIINNPFYVYDPAPGVTVITRLDVLESGTELITGFMPDEVSGVSVIHQSDASKRRVHYCAPDFDFYSSDGFKLLYNVIIWNLPELNPPPLGEEINIEGFEGESGGEISLAIWDDDLENGVILPDSVPIFTDFTSGGKNMIWSFASEPDGEITRLTDETLEMHRTSSGSYVRNLAVSAVDLSPYTTISDELYITVDTWKGTYESINSEDGVFLVSIGGALDTLISEDFENLAMGNGDIEFWGDLYGRHRVHSPEPSWNNTTTFVTLDSRINGASPYSRSRMILELDTSGLASGASITVNYRMADHGDESHAFNGLNNSGDYIGWSLGNGIDDTVLDPENLTPHLYSNGIWRDFSYTFTLPVVMPSKLYIVFSQHDNYKATSRTSADGISFDDITVLVDNTYTDMDRVGTPSFSADWQRIAVDLDDASITHSVPFALDFGIALSQYGMGSWPGHGMHWRNFELGIIEEKYVLPGWSHGPVTVGGIDDWLLEEIAGGHKWTLHANHPSEYSNSSDCWLETPSVSIPYGSSDVNFSFLHLVSIDEGNDFGWVEVSTNDGVSWQVLEINDYTHPYDGHQAFSGTISERTVSISLDSFAGQTVKFRFMFHSDASTTRNGWELDNFEITGTAAGILINSIAFKPDPSMGTWYFNEVDVYLGLTEETVFIDGGELNKADLTFMGTHEVYQNSIDEWVTISFVTPFVLTDGYNLAVKMEMSQTGTSSGYEWVVGTHPNTTRYATSASGDPTWLLVAGQRPACVIDVDGVGLRGVDQGSPDRQDKIPLAFGSEFGDFEAIYTPEDFGFSGASPWIAGGDDNDWEIGIPLFVPDVDPALIPRNENVIAGNDLTGDGYYCQAPWNWMRSGAYEMAETAAYDSVALSYDRCLRKSFNDEAFIQMAFTTSAEPPTEETDWITVKDCDYDDNIWLTDVVQLTYYFEEARTEGKTHYFVRFVLSAGFFLEKGGWNIDNIGFYGRYAE